MRFVWLVGLVGCHREAAPVVAAKPVVVVPARVIEPPKLAQASAPVPEVPPEPDYADAFAMADRFGGAIVIGHVTDVRSGEALAGVTVVAAPHDGETQAAITDELGAYRLDIPRGGYTFAFYYADYTAAHELDIGGSLVIDETIDQAYESTSQGFTIDCGYITNIPVPGRTFEEALGAAADEQGEVEDQIE